MKLIIKNIYLVLLGISTYRAKYLDVNLTTGYLRHKGSLSAPPDRIIDLQEYLNGSNS